jgi:elongation factor Ts
VVDAAPKLNNKKTTPARKKAPNPAVVQALAPLKKEYRRVPMVEINASLVKELRDETGVAMMDCKKALVEAEGDKEKARELLRKRGVAVAEKKASRGASEGLVVAAIAPDQKSGVILEVNCETDFVARNEEFVAMANEIAKTALTSKSKDVDALLLQKIGSSPSVKDFITERVAKTGENMGIRRVEYFEADGTGLVGNYVHALGGKMGCLLLVKASKEPSNKEEAAAVARDVAMHITSAKPQFVNRTEIPADVVEKERSIEREREDLKNKPDNIRDKIVEGRVDKLMAERCLMDQPFIKDPSKTIQQFLQEKGKGLGADLTPVKFALFILGADSGSNGNG